MPFKLILDHKGTEPMNPFSLISMPGFGYNPEGIWGHTLKSVALKALNVKSSDKPWHETTSEALTKVLPKQYYPATTEFLKAHGHTVIHKVDVMRKPLSALTTNALQLATMGTWDEAMHKAGYDNFFHLALLFNGSIITEKLFKVSVRHFDGPKPNTEFKSVPMAAPTTLHDMMEKTRLFMGDEKFFHYDAFYNNCQNFVLSILAANHLLTPDLEHFIHQPLSEIISHNPPWLPTVAKTLTSAGALLGFGRKAPLRRKRVRNGEKQRNKEELFEVPKSFNAIRQARELRGSGPDTESDSDAGEAYESEEEQERRPTRQKKSDRPSMTGIPFPKT